MHAYGGRQGGLQGRGGGGGRQLYSTVTGTEVTSTTVLVVTKVVVLESKTTSWHRAWTISGVSVPSVSFVWHKPLLASTMNRRDATIRVRMVDGVVKLSGWST